VVLRGAPVQRNRHGGLDRDVAELAETRRFEELEDERWQRAQHQLDVRGGRGMTRVDENVEPGGVDVADVGEIDDECRGPARQRPRSEEHTSELQSPYDLVCRLLLEK